MKSHATTVGNSAGFCFVKRSAYFGVVLGFLFQSASLHAVINAHVSVDTNSVLSTMSPLGVGLHTSPYYNNLSNANVDERLEEAGVTTLRFGGGGYADVFHWSIGRASWENGITGGGLSPWFGEAGNFGYTGSGSDFASFINLLDRTENSRAVATVNYGSALKLVNGASQVPDFGGQPKEAAAWVAYANADPGIYNTPNDIVLGIDQQGNDWKTAGYWARLRASTANEYQNWATADGVFEPLNSFLAVDRDAPVGIQYWEIGNETFGTGYYDGSTGYSVDYDQPYNGANRELNPNLSPARYGQDLVEYAELMRAVDPTIKIGAVLATPPDDYNWSYADLNGNGRRGSAEPFWNDEVLSQDGVAENVDFVMVHWYPYAGENANGSSLLAEIGNKIPRMIDGTTAGQDSGTNAGVRDSLVAHGLPNAEIMITEFNYFGSIQANLENAAESIYVADAYASWLERGVTSVQYLEMLTKDFLSDSGALTRGSAFYGISMLDRLAQPGESFVESTSTNSLVRGHAALQDDGSIAVMLLNHSLNDSADVEIDIEGMMLASTGAQYSLTDGTNLSESIATGLGNSFSVSVPARSIAVFVIDPDLTLAGDFDGDGDVDGRDVIELLRGNPEGDLSLLLAQWERTFGNSGSSPGSSAVPEPAATALLAITGLLLTARRSNR